MKDLKETMKGDRITASKTTEVVTTAHPPPPMEIIEPHPMENAPIVNVRTIIVTEETAGDITIMAVAVVMDNTAKEAATAILDLHTGIVHRMGTITIDRMGMTVMTNVRIIALAHSKGMTNDRPKRIPLPLRETLCLMMD
jgi:hypothetical protein